MIGDFNQVCTQDKKSGGSTWLGRQVEKFWVALEEHGLFDLGWKEHKYTWSKAQG